MTVPSETPRYPFDTRPLTDAVDSRAVSEFWRQIKAKHPTSIGSVIAWVVLGMVGVVVVVPVLGSAVFGIILGTTGGGHGPLGAAFSLPLILIAVGLGVGIPLSVVTSRRRRLSTYRIARFAQANGMAYEHRVDAPGLPGVIFQNGSARTSTALVRGFQPRFVEFGNYQYTTGSGKNRTTHHWGYVAVRLDVPLPNIVLDALGNNGLGSNLPASFSRDQRLSLEGDFDRYFTLYCPRGYEADALYLFTPDIMARFIDHAAQLDVEIVDDWMFLYMQRPASTTDPATWAWLFGAVGALMTKFDQWARWRDERLRAAQAEGSAGPAAVSAGAASAADSTGATAPVPPAPLPFAPPAGMVVPPPGVAPPGRRLKKGVSWVTIVVFIVVFLFAVVPQLFGGLLSLFLR
ncbi:hypothetical protein [Microbacterium sp.]|uniref:hypothetical protein n=1 Tax=Microbacterium sp. TaxID=51671 RepID=UPI002810C1A6|nr:hypothetical protein [Microbacterium sp.]